MKSTRISGSISRATKLVLCLCLLTLSACIGKPSVSEPIVLNDDHEIRGAWDCQPDGTQCKMVADRVTISLGWLRSLSEDLQVCYGEGTK